MNCHLNILNSHIQVPPIPKVIRNWTIGRKIGAGSFGLIYAAKHSSGIDVAVKFECSTAPHPQLFFEAKVLKSLRGAEGIPKVYWYGICGNYNVMIMEMLGPSLEEVFTACCRHFSVMTTCLLGLQMLDRVEAVHRHGYLHQDIKPDNFLIGPPGTYKQNHVYAIDFGLAKRYKDNFGNHIPYREGKSLTGTARYVSINTHIGVEQARRDDLEGLAYVFLYFIKGQLPWQGLKANGKEEKYRKVMQKKIDTKIEDLCKNAPKEFELFLRDTRNLQFTDTPDYEKLRNFLIQAAWPGAIINKTDYTALLNVPSVFDSCVYDWYNQKKDTGSFKKENQDAIANIKKRFKYEKNLMDGNNAMRYRDGTCDRIFRGSYVKECSSDASPISEQRLTILRQSSPLKGVNKLITTNVVVTSQTYKGLQNSRTEILGKRRQQPYLHTTLTTKEKRNCLFHQMGRRIFNSYNISNEEISQHSFQPYTNNKNETIVNQSHFTSHNSNHNGELQYPVNTSISHNAITFPSTVKNLISYEEDISKGIQQEEVLDSSVTLLHSSNLVNSEHLSTASLKHSKKREMEQKRRLHCISGQSKTSKHCKNLPKASEPLSNLTMRQAEVKEFSIAEDQCPLLSAASPKVETKEQKPPFIDTVEIKKAEEMSSFLLRAHSSPTTSKRLINWRRPQTLSNRVLTNATSDVHDDGVVNNSKSSIGAITNSHIDLNTTLHFDGHNSVSTYAEEQNKLTSRHRYDLQGKAVNDGAKIIISSCNSNVAQNNPDNDRDDQSGQNQRQLQTIKEYIADSGSRHEKTLTCNQVCLLKGDEQNHNTLWHQKASCLKTLSDKPLTTDTTFECSNTKPPLSSLSSEVLQLKQPQRKQVCLLSLSKSTVEDNKTSATIPTIIKNRTATTTRQGDINPEPRLSATNRNNLQQPSYSPQFTNNCNDTKQGHYSKLNHNSSNNTGDTIERNAKILATEISGEGIPCAKRYRRSATICNRKLKTTLIETPSKTIKNVIFTGAENLKTCGLVDSAVFKEKYKRDESEGLVHCSERTHDTITEKGNTYHFLPVESRYGRKSENKYMEPTSSSLTSKSSHYAKYRSCSCKTEKSKPTITNESVIDHSSHSGSLRLKQSVWRQPESNDVILLDANSDCKADIVTTTAMDSSNGKQTGNHDKRQGKKQVARLLKTKIEPTIASSSSSALSSSSSSKSSGLSLQYLTSWKYSKQQCHNQIAGASNGCKLPFTKSSVLILPKATPESFVATKKRSFLNNFYRPKTSASQSPVIAQQPLQTTETIKENVSPCSEGTIQQNNISYRFTNKHQRQPPLILHSFSLTLSDAQDKQKSNNVFKPVSSVRPAQHYSYTKPAIMPLLHQETAARSYSRTRPQLQQHNRIKSTVAKRQAVGFPSSHIMPFTAINQLRNDQRLPDLLTNNSQLPIASKAQLYKSNSTSSSCCLNKKQNVANHFSNNNNNNSLLPSTDCHRQKRMEQTLVPCSRNIPGSTHCREEESEQKFFKPEIDSRNSLKIKNKANDQLRDYHSKMVFDDALEHKKQTQLLSVKKLHLRTSDDEDDDAWRSSQQALYRNCSNLYRVRLDTETPKTKSLSQLHALLTDRPKCSIADHSFGAHYFAPSQRKQAQKVEKNELQGPSNCRNAQVGEKRESKTAICFDPCTKTIHSAARLAKTSSIVNVSASKVPLRTSSCFLVSRYTMSHLPNNTKINDTPMLQKNNTSQYEDALILLGTNNTLMKPSYDLTPKTSTSNIQAVERQLMVNRSLSSATSTMHPVIEAVAKTGFVTDSSMFEKNDTNMAATTTSSHNTRVPTSSTLLNIEPSFTTSRMPSSKKEEILTFASLKDQKGLQSNSHCSFKGYLQSNNNNEGSQLNTTANGHTNNGCSKDSTDNNSKIQPIFAKEQFMSTDSTKDYSVFYPKISKHLYQSVRQKDATTEACTLDPSMFKYCPATETAPLFNGRKPIARSIVLSPLNSVSKQQQSYQPKYYYQDGAKISVNINHITTPIKPNPEPLRLQQSATKTADVDYQTLEPTLTKDKQSIQTAAPLSHNMSRCSSSFSPSDHYPNQKSFSPKFTNLHRQAASNVSSKPSNPMTINGNNCNSDLANERLHHSSYPPGSNVPAYKLFVSSLSPSSFNDNRCQNFNASTHEPIIAPVPNPTSTAYPRQIKTLTFTSKSNGLQKSPQEKGLSETPCYVTICSNNSKQPIYTTPPPRTSQARYSLNNVSSAFPKTKNDYFPTSQLPQNEQPYVCVKKSLAPSSVHTAKSNFESFSIISSNSRATNLDAAVLPTSFKPLNGCRLSASSSRSFPLQEQSCDLNHTDQHQPNQFLTVATPVTTKYTTDKYNSSTTTVSTPPFKPSVMTPCRKVCSSQLTKQPLYVAYTSHTVLNPKASIKRRIVASSVKTTNTQQTFVPSLTYQQSTM